MPTYQEAIDRLGQKLRDTEAWPDDASKLSEQLHLLFNAALAVGKSVSLKRLLVVESEALTKSQDPIRADVHRFSFPADIFRLREDLGIDRFLLDDEEYEITEMLPMSSLVRMSETSIHADRVLFSVNLLTRALFAQNVEEAKLLYVKQFTKPANAAADFPLPDDNDLELAASIVAAHVAGETIRDPAQATFQSLLMQMYGGEAAHA